MDQIAALAAAQCGLVARWQLAPVEGAVPTIDRWLDSGRLLRVMQSVYSFPGHVDSWQRNLWAAQLHGGPNAVISHESAGRLHHISEVPSGLVVVSMPRGATRSPRSVRWCRVDDLPQRDRVRIDGLQCTTLDRTLVDLATVLGPTRLRRAMESCVVERRVTVERVGATFSRVRRRGKPGVRKLEAVLDQVGPGTDLPRSELERMLDQVIALAGIPAPIHEHPLPSLTGRSGRVDRFWPDARLIVEADGRIWHARHQQMAKDLERNNEAMALGCATARFMWEHLQSDPHGSAALLRSIYLDRRHHAPT